MPEWLSSRLPEWVETWHLVVFSIALAVVMASVERRNRWRRIEATPGGLFRKS